MCDIYTISMPAKIGRFGLIEQLMKRPENASFRQNLRRKQNRDVPRCCVHRKRLFIWQMEHVRLHAML